MGTNPLRTRAPSTTKGRGSSICSSTSWGKPPSTRPSATTGPRTSSGNASTTDLRTACEARYGQTLTWFFDQWVYTPKRPIYRFSYAASTGSVTLTLDQTQPQKVANRTSGKDTYIMPVDFTLHYQDGTAETRTVLDDKRSQAFTFSVSKPVTSVGFDEGHWILKAMR